MRRIPGLVLALVLAALPGAAHALDDAIPKALAPSGTLKAALYPGTPTSILRDEGAASKGVGFEVGRELAHRLGVPYGPIVYAKNADVQSAIQTSAADVAFTNASPARAQIMDFAEPYLDLELGYLVPKGSPIHAVADIDQPGRKVGVTIGSTSESALSKDLKQAQVVRADTSATAIQMLGDGRMDAFATNKATLFEMAEKLPGATVLDGRWGLERHAMGIPKGRGAAAMAFLQTFTRDIVAEGLVSAAVRRAGLRGVLEPGAK